MTEHNEKHETGHESHVPSDTVMIPFVGWTFNIPGGIYTFVFGILFVLTIFEVAIAELPAGPFTLPILLLASLLKAVLVVTYYMHLNKDNPFYRFTLAIPVGVMLISAIWLLAVPPVAY
ncbi:MAG: cytochrome C oxidase subunit IV family protein [Anaerolineae bacterium]